MSFSHLAWKLSFQTPQKVRLPSLAFISAKSMSRLQLGGRISGAVELKREQESAALIGQQSCINCRSAVFLSFVEI